MTKESLEKQQDLKNSDEPNNPLVSVIVITYNSARFVLETLESIKSQTYQNIELIVSDDGSSDETTLLCKNWMQENKDRFVHSLVIEVDKNSGIPANCNRGLEKSSGEWIKLIAGDDLLLEHAITTVLRETKKYPQDQFFYTQGLNFEEINGKMITYDTLLPEILPRKVIHNELDHEGQYKLLLLRQYIFAPSCLIHKNVFEQVGGFNLKYPLLEDYPFYLKCTKNGIRTVFLPFITVKYRSHHDSVYHKDQNKFVVNVKFKNVYNLFLDDEIIPNTTKSHRLGIYWIRFFENIVLKLGNRRNIMNRIIVNIGIQINPFISYYKFRNKTNLTKMNDYQGF